MTPPSDAESQALLVRLQEQMKVALKSGQKQRLSVLRMLLSDVKNIDLAPKPTTAQEAVAAYTKKLRKSMEEYAKLGKPQEVADLKFEISVAEEFLPKKADPQETQKLVDAFVAQNAFTTQQFGQAMGAFMKAPGAAVHAQTARALLRKALAGK